jgi:hypothetical protein
MDTVLSPMAAENGLGGAPRVRQKKKSALTKLAERKKRQVGDADSEYGSRISLQGNGKEDQTAVTSSGVIPLEPQVIVEKKSLGQERRLSGSSCVPCKSVPSEEQLDKEKPKPKPRRHSRTVSSDNIRELEQLEEKSKGDRKINGEKSKTEPKSEEKNHSQENGGSSSSRSGPTDSTIYRFRNMRMAPEQPESVDGKLQGPFVPKPPATPRTPRSAVVKGEKRNHEHSSGEEAEVDNKRLTPNADGEKIDKSEKLSRDTARQVGSTRTNHGHIEQSPALSSLRSRRSSDPANETITQLHSQYQQLMDADSSKNSPLAIRRDSLGSGQRDSLSGSTPRSGRLAPLEARNPPPPMDTDIVAPGLRTAYKADPNYRPPTSSTLRRLTQRMLSDGALMNNAHLHGSPGDHVASDTMSLSSGGVLPVITTKEARSR